jgi:hypothetical protein
MVHNMMNAWEDAGPGERKKRERRNDEKRE